jgi:ubiquinone/menaquinone biosynthesis C-methylase UbiE
MPKTTKYNKPIDKPEFWKQRIDTAQQEHFSVYVIEKNGWNLINQIHKKIILDNIPKDANVLDAGCAYGRWADLFENYIGIDLSPDFIKLAEGKHKDKKFLVGNLKNLPFVDKEFDWSVCVSIKKMVIDNLGDEEWNKIEKELKRVSKKILILEYEMPLEFEVIW